MDEEYTSSVTGASIEMQTMEPSISFMGNGGKPALTIKVDGSIQVGEGFTPDEAGKAAVKAMRHHLQFLIADENETCAKIADSVRKANENKPGVVASVQHDTAAHIAQEIRSRVRVPNMSPTR